MMSILLSVAVLVGVSEAGILGYHSDAGDGGPIELPEARRICASLCMSGLGGRPCGSDCQYLEPPELPIQSENKSRNSEVPSSYKATTRRSACPLLCYYQLGDPLCSCQPQQRGFDSIFFKVDFDRICRWFCAENGYQIYGCPTCDSYESAANETETDAIFKITSKNKDVDWDAWCKQKCREGDGGVACNYDCVVCRRGVRQVAPQKHTSGSIYTCCSRVRPFKLTDVSV